MCLSNANGKTITLGELIRGIKDTIVFNSKVYVPMYQRNYKWNQSTAVQLVEDLIDAYTDSKTKSISLFTLYIDDKNNIQVVDGQQRMITLLLLFTALGKAGDFIKLEFERDFSLSSGKRSDFISGLPTVKEVALTDKRRFKYNYSGIKRKLDNGINKNDIENFVTYLKENVSLLLHITKDEPVSEFLNLNCNKTKFSICDRVRSTLITYPAFNTIANGDKKKLASILDCSDYKKGLSALFEEITRLLYIKDIYNTVKLGYEDPDKTNENRINIMFCDLLEDSSKGYTNCKSIDNVDKIELLYKLAYYRRMLQELECDKESYQTHRAFRNFHYHHKVKFFELINNYINKQDKCNLYDILHMEHSIDKHIFDYIQQNLASKDTYFVNSYFEVLSKVKKPEENDNYSSLLEEQFKNNSVSKSKYFSLDKDMFEGIVQSSGKYILYRYINERHKENENIISFPPTLTFDDVKNVECANNVTPLTEITVGTLLEKDIIIPVIQRDYCMGSHFNQQDKSDMLDYIIDSYNKNKAITLSAITIFHPQENVIYIYDGQQRIFTLACLVKLLDYSPIVQNITFEHREGFNEFIKKFFKNAEMNADSYASKSIANLRNALVNKLGTINKSNLCNYILKNIKFDVITVNGKLSTAEQFFVEINDGVQLVPYEIFKCKINAKFEKLITCDKELNENYRAVDIEDCPSKNKPSYEEWVSNIDNVWLDYFYILNETNLTDEDAVEELMEIRFIEFCTRMIYWEKYLNNKSNKQPLEIKSFEKSGNEMGDMDILIETLTISDFERIRGIMNRLLQFKKNPNAVSCIEKDCGNDRVTGFSHYNPDRYDKDYLIERFLYSLQNDKLDYHDVIIWGVLNGYDANIIKDLMNYWNNKKINKNNFAVLHPGFIGVWHHICLLLPAYYTNKSYDLIEMALDRELIDNIEKEYDDVMRHLCLKSNNGTLTVLWGDNSARYARKWNDLANIAATDVFYYRTGSSKPEKVENKKIVSCNYSNYVVLANEDNKVIYCALTPRYENSTRFMKGVGKVIKIETSNASYQVTIQTSTKDNIYTETIQILK